MSSIFRLSACLLTPACCVLSAASDAKDSPIMELDEVIGIEIQRVSLAQKVTEEGRRNGLLVDDRQDSSFDLIRRFDPGAVHFRSIQTRMVKGGWASAMTVVPKGSGPFPAVFILDDECRYLRFPGIMPEEMAVDDFEGPVYARIPLVSHIVSSGFAVAMPTTKILSKGRGTMTDRDWIALITLFKAKSRIEPESLFLVATNEFAELAVRLATNFSFAGVVIEAPRKMMFVEAAARRERKRLADSGESDRSSTGEQETSQDVTSPETYFQSRMHMVFYAEYAYRLKAPTLVVLAKEAPEYDQTRQTLLAALVAGEVDFGAVLLDRWPRTLTGPGEQTGTWVPSQEEPLFDPTASKLPGIPTRVRSPFRYDNDQFSRWIEQMTIFLVSHSNAKPMALPLPQQVAPGTGRGGLEDAIDQVTGDPATGVDRFGYEDETDPNLPDRD